MVESEPIFQLKSQIDLGDAGMHECIVQGIPHAPSGDQESYTVTEFKVKADIPWTEGQVDITDYLIDKSHEILQHELLRNWSELKQKRAQGETHETK